ncbi:MAG: ATP-binding protein, partial [Thermoguttaceae bacterium]|nr:ATP-binding protein [Thermoguttaceae bacterium]
SANALRARIKQAAFPVSKDFDTYEFAAMPTLNKPKILDLARGEWIDQHDNVCLIGAPGTTT